MDLVIIQWRPVHLRVSDTSLATSLKNKQVDNKASHSGYSTKDCSIVQLSIESIGLAAGDACLKYQIYDGLLSIQDGSCLVFEYFQ